MTATHPMTKIVRKAGSDGSSSGLRCKATACAMAVAASNSGWQGDRQQRAASWPGVPQQPPGAERHQGGRSSRGEPAVGHLDRTGKARERAQQEQLSLQLAQQLGSKKGSRNSARPSATTAASR